MLISDDTLAKQDLEDARKKVSDKVGCVSHELDLLSDDYSEVRHLITLEEFYKEIGTSETELSWLRFLGYLYELTEMIKWATENPGSYDVDIGTWHPICKYLFFARLVQSYVPSIPDYPTIDASFFGMTMDEVHSLIKTIE